MVIGIVGKIGSGKSAVTKYLNKKYGAICFSCDEIAKEIIENGESDYEPGFSGEIFINEKKQEECRTLLHPIVFGRIKERIENLKNKNNLYDKNNINNKNNFTNKNNLPEQLFIIESALPNKTMFEMCDKVIYIESTYQNRVKRLKETRDYTEEKTKLIDDTQKYYEHFYNMADYKIDNDGTCDLLIKKVEEVLNEIYFTCK